jgi:hypothetical protein
MILLDFITSKIAMMVAAVVILTSVLGIFAWQREDSKDIELRNIADEISGSINEINSISGETKINITFEKSNDGIYLNPRVDGKAYKIIISQNEVIVRQNERLFLRNFINAVHIWEPDSEAYEKDEIKEKDRKSPEIELKSEENFQIYRKLVNSGEGKEYMTFVYT